MGCGVVVWWWGGVVCCGGVVCVPLDFSVSPRHLGFGFLGLGLRGLGPGLDKNTSRSQWIIIIIAYTLHYMADRTMAVNGRDIR